MLSQKGLLFNILFILYAWLIQTPIAARMDRVMENRQAWVSMSVVLFIVSLLEGLYLPLKIKTAFFRTRRELTPNEATLWFMLPIIFRMIIGLAVSVTVFSLMVPDIRHRSILSAVAAVMAMVLIIKELFALFAGLILLMKNRAREYPAWIEWAGDFLILLYSCIAYTLLTRPGFYFTKGQFSSIAMIPLITFVFFAFLLSLRLGFYVEEYLSAIRLRDKIAISFTLLIAAFSAAWQLMG